MAKRKNYRRSSKCPEPLNTMIDIAGAVTMGLVSRSMVKKDIKKGQGRESVAAARMVFGAGSLRRGGEGLMNLGGLMGVESAVRSAEREAQRKHSYVEEDPLIADLERRINTPQIHHSSAAKSTYIQTTPAEKISTSASAEVIEVDEETYIFCRVSRLDNGSNGYYLADHDYIIGSTVQVEKEDGFALGVILTVEKHSLETAPIAPENAKRIVD